MDVAERRREVDGVVAQLVALAHRTPGIRAIGIVGSWARAHARPDSDLDIIVLADEAVSRAIAADWLRQLGVITFMREQRWGVVTEYRGRLSSGLEIELGVGPLCWADTGPIDAGTLRVARDGLRILFDPDDRLAGLKRAVDERADDESVRVVPYDPEWPARFDQEKAQLEASIAPWVTGGASRLASERAVNLAA
jgi:predicted nucleotidyltransferase